MIRLFIFDKEVELDKEVQFTLTKQFEDLANPTTIINDWSKTVEIPATSKNNELFGSIFHPDRVIPTGSITPIGLYFDPTKKLDFRLEWNSNIMMVGYAKFNTVSRVNNKTTYNITLNGQLGNLFQEMKKITFDENDTEGYYIDGRDYFTATMSKELVRDCFMHPNGDSLNPLSITNWIGFAPCTATDDDVDTTIYQDGGSSTSLTGSVKPFIEILEGNKEAFRNATGIPADNVIGDGVQPREIGEFRSYKQIPYIHFRKLFEIFKDKAEEVTGYSINLDSTWSSSTSSNRSNFYNLAYMLRRFNTENSLTYNNTYGAPSTTINWTYTGGMATRDSYNPYCGDPAIINFTPSSVNEQYEIYNGDSTFGEDGVKRLYKLHGLNCNFRATLSRNYDSTTEVRMSDYNYLVVSVNIVREDDTLIDSRRVAILAEDCELPVDIYDAVYRIPHTNIRYIGDTISATFALPEISFITDESFRISISTLWFDTVSPTTHISRWQYKTGSNNWGTATWLDMSLYTSGTLQIDPTPKFYRSGFTFTLNDLWNNEYNLFDEILKYTKSHGLVWIVDNINKRVDIVPRTTYFVDYTVADWTDKLDLSKEFIITPTLWEDKYILFNYKDSDIDLNESYKAKYGYNYGEKRLITDYNFNTETKSLFDDISGGLIYTPNILSWSSLEPYKEIRYSLPKEKYVCCRDKDGKYVDVFGTMFFVIGTQTVDDSGRLRSCVISDDTPFQVSHNTYCYSQDKNSISFNVLPLLSTVDGEYCSLFTQPLENYTYDKDLYTSTSGITGLYERYWYNYISERYNKQNKKITCYLKITPTDFCNFKFNRFVIIDNQLCIINKIYDYDIVAGDSTKVDLITIQDINGYTTDNFVV